LNAYDQIQPLQPPERHLKRQYPLPALPGDVSRYVDYRKQTSMTKEHCVNALKPCAAHPVPGISFDEFDKLTEEWMEVGRQEERKELIGVIERMKEEVTKSEVGNDWWSGVHVFSENLISHLNSPRGGKNYFKEVLKKVVDGEVWKWDGSEYGRSLYSHSEFSRETECKVCKDHPQGVGCCKNCHRPQGEGCKFPCAKTNCRFHTAQSSPTSAQGEGKDVKCHCQSGQPYSCSCCMYGNCPKKT